MKAACLLGVLILSRALILACGMVPLSVWTPLAFFWQDALFVLGFAAVEQALRNWPRLGWGLYALIVLYVAVSVPVACELSTPLTWPLLRAVRGTLADSIRAHVTPLNLLRLGLILAAAAVLPWIVRRRWQAVAPRWKAGLGLLLLVLAIPGPWASHRCDTLGLHRNFFVTLLASAFPRVAARGADADWRISPFGSRPGEDLSRLRGKAKGRNVVLIHLESAAARYLRCYGAKRIRCRT